MRVTREAAVSEFETITNFLAEYGLAGGIVIAFIILSLAALVMARGWSANRAKFAEAAMMQAQAEMGQTEVKKIEAEAERTNAMSLHDILDHHTAQNEGNLKALGEMVEQLRAMNAQHDEHAEALGQVRGDVEIMRPIVEDVGRDTALIREGLVAHETLVESNLQLVNASRELVDTMREMLEALSEMTQQVKTLSENAEEANGDGAEMKQVVAQAKELISQLEVLLAECAVKEGRRITQEVEAVAEATTQPTVESPVPPQAEAPSSKVPPSASSVSDQDHQDKEKPNA
jgi:methyl-accepting chemotaxis protein